jgi:uncharacterized protein YbjT (DUF2867 family)
MRRRQVVVVGGTGFIGTEVCNELIARGWSVSTQSAPRLRASAGDVEEIVKIGSCQSLIVAKLAAAFEGMDAVVNAAGLARPTSRDCDALVGANALLPQIVGEACRLAGVDRMVHVSSAAVQGDVPYLDESMSYRATSPYARSKALGEQVLAESSAPGTTVLRPTSVHGPNRALTRRIIRFARSRFSCVMAPGRAPTPQVLVENVGAVVAYLCAVNPAPPPIVLQPWEGWTTSSFLHFLSGHQPFQLSKSKTDAILSSSGALSKVFPVVAQHRRLEILWRGHRQAPGWLSSVGFEIPYGKSHWSRIIIQPTDGGIGVHRLGRRE